MEDVRAETGFVAPATSALAIAALYAPPAPEEPRREMSAVRSVTQYIVASCREHLPVQATHPVGEFVVEYAAAAAGRMSELVDLPAA